MNHILIYSIFVFWALRCRNIISIIIFIFAFIYYEKKYHKFNKIYYALLIVLYITSFSPYVIRNNTVIETHETYVIASIHHKKTMIYTDEVYFENEKVEVFSEPKEVESYSNFNLFNFKSYLNQLNAHQYLNNDDVHIEKGSSIKRKLYEKVQTMDDTTSSYLRKILYQFDTDDFIVSSGLHFNSIYHLFVSVANQFTNQTISKLFSSTVLCFFSYLFPYQFSFLRIIVGSLIDVFFKDLSKTKKVGLQYLICMIIEPSCVFRYSFLVPYLLTICSIFNHSKNNKIVLSKLLIIFMQFFTFNKCTVLSIFFFNTIRKINAFCLISSLITLVIPISSLYNFMMKIIESIFQLINHVCFYGKPCLFFNLLFAITFFLYWNGKIKPILSIFVVLLIPIQTYLSPFYEVVFLNVGQGDSILIRAPFNQNNILVDIPSNFEDRVIDYLKSEGIHHLDSLVFTHNDSDHNGGKEKFMNLFKVNQIIEKHENIQFLNDEIYSINSNNHLNDNDNSIVLYFKCGELKYLLMGDASKEVEKELINIYELDCDVLKIGHHGSDTSTDSYFLQTIEPNIGIISVSKHNRYNHPSDNVLERLEQYGITLYQTSTDGAISIKSFLKFNFITTSNGKFGIILAE